MDESTDFSVLGSPTAFCVADSPIDQGILSLLLTQYNSSQKLKNLEMYTGVPDRP
jgi:hypothetical protein